MHDGAVANGDKLTYARRSAGIDMNDGIVLDIGTRADDNAINVAAQNGAVPDARFLFERNVADDGRAGNDPGAWVDGRPVF